MSVSDDQLIKTVLTDERSVTGDHLIQPDEILFERFIIEPISEDSRKIQKRCVAKDVKNFCRRVIFRRSTASELDRADLDRSFLQVCETLKRLEHPNIESIIETGSITEGGFYVLSEYEEGRSLAELIEGSKRYETAEIARILRSSAKALFAAHRKGILHCDVRPSNIFISSESSRVRVTNFGVGWPVDERGEGLINASVDLETLEYAAPELFHKLGIRTTASDVYSLAAIVFRLLVGDVPHKGQDRHEIMQSQLQGLMPERLTSRTDLSTAAERIIEQGLQIDPTKRPSNIEKFGYELADELIKTSGFPLAAKRSTNVIQTPAIISSESNDGNDVSHKQPDGDLPLTIPGRREKRERANPPKISDKTVILTLIVILLLASLSIPIGQRFFAASEEGNLVKTAPISMNSTESTDPERMLRYSVLDRPHVSAGKGLLGKEIFTISFSSDSDGRVYIFKEVSNDAGSTAYEMLFPPTSNDTEAAAVSTGIKFRSKDFMFSDAEDKRNVWLIWTTVKNKDLEAARIAAVSSNGIVQSDTEVKKLRHIVERGRTQKILLSTDSELGEAVIKGSGDRIVHRIETNVVESHHKEVVGQ